MAPPSTTIETQQLLLRLRGDTYGTLQAEADLRGVSVNALINLLLGRQLTNAPPGAGQAGGFIRPVSSGGAS